MVERADITDDFDRAVVGVLTALPFFLVVVKLSIVLDKVLTSASLELYVPLAVWGTRLLCVVLLFIARASWMWRQLDEAEAHANLDIGARPDIGVPDELTEFDGRLG